MVSRRRTGWGLGVLVAAMFGFAFALVPLYEVFCRVTGVNGKLVEGDPGPSRGGGEARALEVQFVTNVQGHLPWRFRPLARRITVHTGEYADAFFEVANLSGRATVGRALTNLMPGAAAGYLRKVNCFCFAHQRLDPGEVRRVHLRFVVDPALPPRYRILTLAYTFVEPADGS